MKLKLCLFLLFSGIGNLIAQQEDADHADTSINEKLLIAADAGDTAKVLSLIGRGADVDAITWEGVTSLMYATQNGNLPLMKILVRCGADPDKKPANGKTALITSIINAQPDLTEFLIRNGASVDLADNDRMTPLMHAIVVDSFYIPDLLLYYGADFDAKRSDGVNALMLASLMGRYKIAEELILSGADVNSADDNGLTPLHYASEAGNAAIMELLVSAEADLEAKTGSGYTPLSVAVARNNFKAARLLLGAGANVNSRISNSLNPLTMARENHFDSLSVMLENNGGRDIIWPWFNQITLGGHFSFNSDDMFTGISLGMSDKKYNLWISLGYGIRPKSMRVLELVQGDTYYQYWELRHLASFTMDKAFMLKNKSGKGKVGLVVGIEEAVTFASYHGSGLHPQTDVLFSPRIGLVYRSGFLRYRLNYSYMNLHLTDMSTNWCTISIELLLNRKKGTLNQTSITGI